MWLERHVVELCSGRNLRVFRQRPKDLHPVTSRQSGQDVRSGAYLLGQGTSGPSRYSLEDCGLATANLLGELGNQSLAGIGAADGFGEILFQSHRGGITADDFIQSDVHGLASDVLGQLHFLFPAGGNPEVVVLAGLHLRGRGRGVLGTDIRSIAVANIETGYAQGAGLGSAGFFGCFRRLRAEQAVRPGRPQRNQIASFVSFRGAVRVLLYPQIHRGTISGDIDGTPFHVTGHRLCPGFGNLWRLGGVTHIATVVINRYAGGVFTEVRGRAGLVLGLEVHRKLYRGLFGGKGSHQIQHRVPGPRVQALFHPDFEVGLKGVVETAVGGDGFGFAGTHQNGAVRTVRDGHQTIPVVLGPSRTGAAGAILSFRVADIFVDFTGGSRR